MKQAEKIYLISDAAKQVQVESHVLRYWEEELKLPIKRNELGHRYYTEEDIARFKEVRDLKERGLQLKAIRTLLLNRADTDVSNDISVPGSLERQIVMVNKGEFVPLQEESREAKSLRLQKLLQNMIAEAVRSNNREMCDELKDSLLKELDYQFRLQEEKEDMRENVRLNREEEHYKQIDELIRLRNQKGFRGKKEKNKKKDEELHKEQLQEELLDIQLMTEAEQVKEKPKRNFLRKKRSII